MWRYQTPINFGTIDKMKVISNTDYDKIVRLLPKVLEGITWNTDLKRFNAARQLRNMLDKWNRNKPQ